MDRRQRRAENQKQLEKQSRRAARLTSMMFLVVAALFVILQIWGPEKNKGNAVSQPGSAETASSGGMSQEALDHYLTELKKEWNFILVNGASPLPEGFSVELSAVQGGLQMDSRVAEEMDRMLTAARSDGVELELCSAYRSRELQRELFEEDVQKNMAKGLSREEAEAQTNWSIQRPGFSEHETGLAADIVTISYRRLDEGFENTDAFRWLSEHASEYGFILRYPKEKEEVTKITYEPWHYRYVGRDFAETIAESGLCLEEFLGQAGS